MEQITEEQAIKRLSNNELVWAWKWEDELRSEMRFYDDIPSVDVIRKEKTTQTEYIIYNCELITASIFFSREDVIYTLEKRMMLDAYDPSFYKIEVDEKALEEFANKYITFDGKTQRIGFETYCVRRIA